MDPSAPIDVPRLKRVGASQQRSSSPLLVHALTSPERQIPNVPPPKPRRRSTHGVTLSGSPRSPRVTVQEVDAAKVSICKFLMRDALPLKLHTLLQHWRLAVVAHTDDEDNNELLQKANELCSRVGQEVCLLAGGGYIELQSRHGRAIANMGKLNLASISWKLKDFAQLTQALSTRKQKQLRDSASVQCLGTTFYAPRNEMAKLLNSKRAPVTVELVADEKGTFTLRADRKKIELDVEVHYDLNWHVQCWWQHCKAEYWPPKGAAGSAASNCYVEAVEKLVQSIGHEFRIRCLLSETKFINCWDALFLRIFECYDLMAQMAHNVYDSRWPVVCANSRVWLSRRYRPDQKVAILAPAVLLQQSNRELNSKLETLPDFVTILFNEKRPFYLSVSEATELLQLAVPEIKPEHLPKDKSIKINFEGRNSQLAIVTLDLTSDHRVYYNAEAGTTIEDL